MARASPSCSVPLRVFWALSSGWYHIPALAQCSERGIPQQQKTKTPTQPMDQGAHLSRFKKQLSQVTRRHIYIYMYKLEAIHRPKWWSITNTLRTY